MITEIVEKSVKEIPLSMMRSFKLPYAEVTCFGCAKPREFYFSDLNREIDSSKIEQLVSSMLSKGYNVFQPIVANSDGMIVDGQHRLLASIKSGVVPHISVYEHLDDKSIIQMNTLRTNWSASDYVHYYATGGNSSYMMLSKLSKKFSISPVTVQQTIKRTITSGKLSNELKNGTFRCTQGEAEQADLFLAEVMPLVNLIRLCNKNRCISALSRVSGIIGKSDCFERILRNMKKYPDKVYKCSTTENYVGLFIDLYNIGLSESKKIRMYYR